MIMLIGGVIMVTLSYVSWRKYRGHKKNEQKRDVNN
ncbi:sporulation protein YpjB [Pseudogracilibacillus sp. SO30301A]